MGKLVQGRWVDEWYGKDTKGHFVRDETQFRDRLSADPSSRYPAEAGRYHLYVSLACPWAHRTLIARSLKGLEEALSVTVVHPHMGQQGWEHRDYPGATPDSVNHTQYLHEVYTRADPEYTGRVTVPVLWDKQQGQIVCNDSRLILRMLSRELDAFAQRNLDLCPAELESEVDRTLDEIYGPVNNGVYRAGFATTQEAYEEATAQLFHALDDLERRLSSRRYLLGARFTEADICLFTTLLRFDVVYHYHFKCNLRRLADYPALFAYLRDVFQRPGVSSTCSLDHIKRHYFTSHPHLNPSAIIPVGPAHDLWASHGRAELDQQEA